MITAEQQEILRLLSEILNLEHEMRIGQLVSNLAWLARAEDLDCTPIIDDVELLQACRDHLANLQKSGQFAACPSEESAAPQR